MLSARAPTRSRSTRPSAVSPRGRRPRPTSTARSRWGTRSSRALRRVRFARPSRGKTRRRPKTRGTGLPSLPSLQILRSLRSLRSLRRSLRGAFDSDRTPTSTRRASPSPAPAEPPSTCSGKKRESTRVSDACPASRAYPTWPFRVSSGARRAHPRTPRPRPKARRANSPSVVIFIFRNARVHHTVFESSSARFRRVVAFGRDSVGGLRSGRRDAWSSGREWRARVVPVREERARSRFGARASPRATTGPSRRALGFSSPRVWKRRKETKSENRRPRASRTRAGLRARASSRVPSPGRREGMRAYFGSFDVARREVKRSEHTGGCRERERRRDVKISDGLSKRNGGS